MSEFYFKAPTLEEQNATYNGMTFNEFKLLDDEAITELREQARIEWVDACENTDDFDDDSWWDARDKADVFADFCTWRKHGLPDRDMTEYEFLERMYHYADTRRAKDPTYGHTDAADTAHLTEAEKELAWFAVQEAWADGVSMCGQPVIQPGGSIHHVEDRLDITLDDLVKKGYLETYREPASILFKESTGYVIAGKFAAYLFSKRYPAIKKE